jgi:hypothetical protein
MWIRGSVYKSIYRTVGKRLKLYPPRLADFIGCMHVLWRATSFHVMTTSHLGDLNPIEDLTVTNFRSIEKPTVPLH